MTNKLINKYKWIDFFGVTDFFNSALDRFISIWNNESKYIVNQVADYKIYTYWRNYYALEFTKSKQRDLYIEWFIKNFKPKWPFCELEPNWNQYPSYQLHWDQNKKYFIVVDALKKLIDNTDLKNWIVDGVIFNVVN